MMFEKFLVVITAMLVFGLAKQQKCALTYLRIGGVTRYRRHKTVRTEVVEIPEKCSGIHKLICRVPEIPLCAAIRVNEKKMQKITAALEKEDKKQIPMEQYRVEGKTFLLLEQEEPDNARYFTSAQKEKAAQEKCMLAREAGFFLLVMGITAGIAVLSVGLLFTMVGAALLWLNIPFADMAAWEAVCQWRPCQEREKGSGQSPEELTQWSKVEEYLHEFAEKYGVAQDGISPRTVDFDSVQLMEQQNLSNEKGDGDSVPAFSRVFQENRYAAKSKPFR